MNLTEDQREEFIEGSRLMIKWLNENTHPHCSIIITSTDAELVEGVCATGLVTEYLED